MSDKPQSTDNPAKTTPKDWKSPQDARDINGAGEYPNYWTHRTRSGHVFTLDDSKDAEHVTLQHRGGSMIQFMPDGAVHFVSHNGQYNLIFGENRVKITGAYDVTVEGGGSLKVDGDYNMTVKGKANFAVGDDFNLTARNFNQTIRGNIDTVAKNISTNAQGNIDIQAKEGAVKITSKMSMLLRSFADSLGLKAKNQVGMESEGDKVMLQSQGNLGFSSQGEIILDTQQKLSLQGSEIDMQATQSDVKITAGSGSIHALSTNNLADPPWQPGAQSAQTDSAPRARNETIAQAVPTIDPQPIIQA